MRTRLLSIALVALTSCAGAEVEAGTTYRTGANTAVSVDLFYDALAPYGTWVQRPGYGRVWVPSPAIVGSDFMPYASAGNWQYSDVGWMFVSQWDWGWAPFHYGGWYFDPLYGWAWVPDTIWGPAWVDWRFGGGLIGWAPLLPRFHHGHHVAIRDHRTRWVFVASRDFRQPGIGHHLLRGTPHHFQVTAPVRQRVQRGAWFAGPDRTAVETATRAPVVPIHVAPPRPGVVMRMQVEGGRARSVPVERRPARARPTAPPRQRPRRPAAFDGRSVPGPVAASPFERGPSRERPMRRSRR